MAVPRRPADASELTSQYTTELLVYPPSLAWQQEHQNYVAFYINVPEASMAAQGPNVLGDLEPLPGAVQDAASAGDGKLTIASKPYKRMKTAIVLPIMEAPTAKYSADWDATALGPVVGYAMTNGMGGGDSFAKEFESMSGALQTGTDALKAIGLAFVNAALPNSLDGETKAADIFSAIKRAAINDHRTQLFRSMRFRDFHFSYKLTPRDAKEASTIKNIIQNFKFHMHPDTAKGNLFLTYPSEFDIVFYYKTKENAGPNSANDASQNMFKISTCALTDFQVDYGGDMFYTFDDGMPTEINMRMSFLELEVLTKERIAEGF